jgi:hypothetical protein
MATQTTVFRMERNYNKLRADLLSTNRITNHKDSFPNSSSTRCGVPMDNSLLPVAVVRSLVCTAL